MSDKNPTPAFPQPFIQNERGVDFQFDGYGRGGITIRQYFAAKALQGMMSNPSIVDTFSAHQTLAKQAFILADEMMKAENE